MREPMNLPPEGRDGQIGGVLCDCAARRENYRLMIFDAFVSLESVLVSEPVSRAHSLRTAKLTKKIFFTFFKKNWEFFLNKVLIEGATRRGFDVSDAKLTET